ncbi:MAG: hypothetical protein E7625_02355 [Ruminococcaceae bacterium]|nr:hypothetical protein [Oscillospiraceae bacterium]
MSDQRLLKILEFFEKQTTPIWLCQTGVVCVIIKTAALYICINVYGDIQIMNDSKKLEFCVIIEVMLLGCPKIENTRRGAPL